MLPSSDRPGRTDRLGRIAQGDVRRVKRSPNPLERVLQPGVPRPGHQGSFAHRVLRPVVDRLTDQGSILMQNVKMDDIRFRLMRAGFPMGLGAREFHLLRIALAFSLAILFPVWVPILAQLFGYNADFFVTIAPFGLPIPVINLPYLLATMLGALYGWKAPDIWLTMVINRRRNEIVLALPDMMDLITVSVEAGLGLHASIQRVSTRFHNPLSEEFLRSAQEVRLGRTHAEALRDMARRVDVEDLTTVVSAIVQADVLGLAIANVLRVQSERLREKRSQRARETAQKAPVKMMFPLVFFIFPALFVVILGPALIKFIESGY